MSTAIDTIVTDEQIAQFERDGYLIVRGMLSPGETEILCERFMEIQRQSLDSDSPLREFYAPKTMEEAEGDILQHFPRIMQPHRFDELSRKYLLDERFRAILRVLLKDEPLAAQSMLYFKPPGARGQAFHQDDYYLRTAPRHCMAAWVGLDKCDAENGTLFVVPGSHVQPVLCPHAADLTKSFTTEEVTIPEGLEPVEVVLEPGDVLFFGGSVIHGSTPNSSTDRFRRSFICHYVPESSVEVSTGYYPLLTFSNEETARGHAKGGGICGNEDWEAFVKGIEDQVDAPAGDGSNAKEAAQWLRRHKENQQTTEAH